MNAADRELKLSGIIAKATEATGELRHLGEAFKTLRAQLVTAWEGTDPRDATGREKLWLATTQLTQVERILRSVASSGAIAKKELDALKSAGEPPRRFFRRA